jgi:hypothetical protein
MGYGNLVPAKKVLLAMFPALLSLAWPATGAVADSCSLTLVNSVPLTVTDNGAWVSASVGRKEKLFQIVTAAPDNQMGKDAMTAFGLRAIDFTPAQSDGGAGAFSVGTAAVTDIDGTARGRSYGSMIGGGASGNATAIYDARGRMFHSWADAAPFTLGSMQTDHVQFVVTDIPEPGSGGILSSGFFQKYDVDLNFQAGRFNMFASNHCNGEVMYWRAPGMAKLPFRFQDGRIVVRVVLDGREMDALIDTGAPSSEMQFDDPDSFFYRRSNAPGVMREINGEHSYNFGVLSFGTVAIYHPHLVLTHAEQMGGALSSLQTGTLLRNIGHTSLQPVLTLGIDLLRMLHLYIAFKERMIYVTQGPELPEGDPKALPVVAVTPFRP